MKLITKYLCLDKIGDFLCSHCFSYDNYPFYILFTSNYYWLSKLCFNPHQARAFPNMVSVDLSFSPSPSMFKCINTAPSVSPSYNVIPHCQTLPKPPLSSCPNFNFSPDIHINNLTFSLFGFPSPHFQTPYYKTYSKSI